MVIKDILIPVQEPAVISIASEPSVDELIEQGNQLEDAGDNTAAYKLYLRAVALAPDSARAHNNLGNALAFLDRPLEAKDSYWRAIDLMPDYAAAHLNLGRVLHTLRSFGEAAAAYREAIRIRPDWPEAWVGLGAELEEIGSVEDVVEAYEQALRHDQMHEGATINLAMILLKLGQGTRARNILLEMLAKDQSKMLAVRRLADVDSKLCEHESAVACYRRILETNPYDIFSFDNLLFTLNFIPEITADFILKEHQRFGDMVTSHVSRLQHGAVPKSDRRLKIGYVSGDFRCHPVSCFFEPLLRNHDRTEMEIFCYCNNREHDDFTQRLNLLADHWCDIVDMEDQDVAQRIIADGIDILVDLSGHTDRNRLPVFACKPAPLQFSWLGYLCTTGLSTIDYRLCDFHTDPVGEAESWQVEKPARLPDSQWCYQPMAEVPERSSLPRLANGYWTFGSFNQISKLNRRVIRAWGRLLIAIPDSRLRIHGGNDPYIEKKISENFAEIGISKDRFEFFGHIPIKDYFRSYLAVDIALDSFPYNGGTTTCDSLIMGVPVAAIAGNRSIARGGVSILNTVGLSDWIAPSEDAFVEMVLRHTQDPQRLAALRAELPARMRASPLMDGARFARNVETIFRSCWQRWCEEQQAKA